MTTKPRIWTGPRLAGALYLLTFITSIPALALKQPALDAAFGRADATVTASTHGQLVAAMILEIILAAACIGTAVALYPTLRTRSPHGALAFVTSRTVEAALIGVGVMAMLIIAGGLADESAAALGASVSDPGTASARVLVTLHDAAFLIGPGLLPIANALILAPVLLRERLLPRAIPVTGIVGAVTLTISLLGTLTASFPQVSSQAALLAIPIAVWEFALGIWLVAHPRSFSALLSRHARCWCRNVVRQGGCGDSDREVMRLRVVPLGRCCPTSLPRYRRAAPSLFSALLSRHARCWCRNVVR